MPGRSSFFAPLSLLAGSLLYSSLFGQDSFDPFRHPLAWEVGIQLTPEQVGSLEQQLAEDPNDLETRVKLIRYYFQQFGDRSAGQMHGEHVLWFVRNEPEAAVLGWSEGSIDHCTNFALFWEGADAWSRHLESDPDSLPKLWNASQFYSEADPKRSIALLERGQSVDNSNLFWAQQLGLQHRLIIHDLEGEPDPEMAGQALAHYERAYALSDEESRDAISIELATTALTAGQIGKAREHAESMLAVDRQGWNEGNRIHYGNLTLGRIALLAGDVEEAKSRLIAAGETPGSPQLNSFGPDMTLAKELLERGESEVVLRYLSLCSEFWELGQEELQAWIARVEEGGTPDFGTSLRF